MENWLLENPLDPIMVRYSNMQPMDELTKRKWAASEALAIGRGGENRVFEATGISRATIRRGIQEIQARKDPNFNQDEINDRIRQPGGGRKKITEKYLDLLPNLHAIIDPITSRDTMKVVKGTSLSTYKISDSLKILGFPICPDTVGKILKEEGFSLQVTHKSIEGNPSLELDAQFLFINESINSFISLNQPIISIDAKKKELVGNISNKSQEWHKKGEPVKVNVYDFLDLGEGKVAPFGVYDISYNESLVSLGTNHDTAEFAVATIRKWWDNIGKFRYNDNPTKMLILADGGGSNSSRSRLWKQSLQNLVNEISMPIYVSHYPPGTSKYNKIEHRMFSYISINWRGKPLLNLNIILNLIQNTTTKTGLKIYSLIDDNQYKIGIKIPDSEFKKININYLNESKLNYRIYPQQK
jgi:hypothetical protein